jgi:NADH-quinone oxidoreductase subunit N
MMNLTLSPTDYASISPLFILLGGCLILLMVESFFETIAKKFSASISVVFIITAMFAAYYAPVSTNPLLRDWIKFDYLSKFFTLLFLSIGLGTTLLSATFFKKFEATRGEYFFLLLSALFGLILVGMSADFLTLFLGLETLSISLYVLCGYMKKWNTSHESAMKYFILGALSAAFLLYGIALIYGAVGTTRFDLLLPVFNSLTETPEITLFFVGISLVTLGLCFKAAIVPFHIWAPDVYDGAPNPVTAFMAVGTKAGAFAAFVRVFMDALPQFDPLWSEGIAWLAIPTLIYANFVALRQVQLRRFFAYSGISHAGFLLIPIAVGTPEALSSLIFYLVVYSLATLGCFAILAFIDESSSGVTMKDLKGLFFRSPLLALIFSICLLTLAGIPPTAGFVSKFYLFKLALNAGYYTVVIVALLTTILSATYYLRIISKMFAEEPSAFAPPTSAWPATVVGVVSLAAIIALSCYPNLLFMLINPQY